MRKILFLDRDGVINVDTHYLHTVSDLQWIAGIQEALHKAVKAGYELVVVTNQSGIARGYYTVAEMELLHQYMRTELGKLGIPILAFYYCPHLQGAPLAEYDVDCNCRKPKPGMILQAFKDYPASHEDSFLIGDSSSDIEAAKAAGIHGYQFAGGNIKAFMEQCLQMEAHRKEDT